MKFVNILHLYQPPTQTKEIVDQVVRESYETILKLLAAYPQVKLTINISGSLLELLATFGHKKIIESLRACAKKGQIEFLGSAMYHPILPLLTEKEIIRQIQLNNDISKKYFGEYYQPKGFYMPEMAYNDAAAKTIYHAGFDWIVLDEIHTEARVSPDTRYMVKNIGLGVLFRDSSFSRTFPPESIVTHFDSIQTKHLIICHDGELYGHWHKDDKGFYKKLCTHPHIQMITASEYLADLSHTKEITVRDASWESKPNELASKVPHALWNSPVNLIHQDLEMLKKIALTIVENHQSDPGYDDARYHADRGVASCAWWWASEVKIGPTSPISWNPTEIEKGATELYKAAASIQRLSQKEKDEVTRLFNNIRGLVWNKHKEKYDPQYQSPKNPPVL